MCIYLFQNCKRFYLLRPLFPIPSLNQPLRSPMRSTATGMRKSQGRTVKNACTIVVAIPVIPVAKLAVSPVPSEMIDVLSSTVTPATITRAGIAAIATFLAFDRKFFIRCETWGDKIRHALRCHRYKSTKNKCKRFFNNLSTITKKQIPLFLLNYIYDIKKPYTERQDFYISYVRQLYTTSIF